MNKIVRYTPAVILILLMIIRLHLNHFKIDAYTICLLISIILDIYYLVLMYHETNKKIKVKVYCAKGGIILFHIVTFFMKTTFIYTFAYVIYLLLIILFLKLKT